MEMGAVSHSKNSNRNCNHVILSFGEERYSYLTFKFIVMKITIHQRDVISKTLLIKFLGIMKLVIILIVISCFQASGHGYPQTVTLNLKSVELKKALTIIEKKSNYRFLYSERKFPDNRKINIDVTNAVISQVLDQLLQVTSLSYKEMGKNLIIPTDRDEQLQDIVVKGNVTDNNGQPLSGVSIQVKGSSAGTSTDAKGNYSLNVPDKAILIVSSVGYNKVEIAVNGKTVLNITLEAATSGLNEVVVTALGIKKEKKALGYAVTSVSAKELNSTGESSLILNLDGKVPGMVVQTSANGLDGTPRVVIRGATSFSADNQPLYVLDGMPLLSNRSLSESLFIVGIFLILLTNSLAGQKTKSVEWEYTIEAVPDLTFTETMDRYGKSGWELVTARRAVDEGTASYECIFKRVKN